MTKYQTHELLEELQSNEAFIRSDAIKKIIKGKINDEHIITALKNVIENDPSMAVRNFARSALDVFGIEHSAIEESAVINSKSFDHNLSPEIADAAQQEIELHANTSKLIEEPYTPTNKENHIGFMKSMGIGAIVGYITIFVTIMWLSILMADGEPVRYPSIQVDILLSLVGIPFGIVGALIGKIFVETSRAVWIGAFIFVCPVAFLLFYLIASI